MVRGGGKGSWEKGESGQGEVACGVVACGAALSQKIGVTEGMGRVERKRKFKSGQSERPRAPEGRGGKEASVSLPGSEGEKDQLCPRTPPKVLARKEPFCWKRGTNYSRKKGRQPAGHATLTT